MQCKNHNETEANYYCSYCGQPLCLECSVELNKKLYCKECLEKSIELSKINFSTESKFKKSKFLTFIFSIMPGAGHMYLGLINKGLSIMISFFGLMFFYSILLDNVFHDDVFFAALFVIFISYSIFDSLSKANDINSGIIVNDSKNIGVLSAYDYIKVNALRRKKFLGYGFIVLGCISIFNMFSRAVDQILQRYLNFNLPFTMTDILISLILICCGVFFIKKGRDISI